VRRTFGRSVNGSPSGAVGCRNSGVWGRVERTRDRSSFLVREAVTADDRETLFPILFDG
jgi:hypothetical protein